MLVNALQFGSKYMHINAFGIVYLVVLLLQVISEILPAFAQLTFFVVIFMYASNKTIKIGMVIKKTQ